MSIALPARPSRQREATVCSPRGVHNLKASSARSTPLRLPKSSSYVPRMSRDAAMTRTTPLPARALWRLVVGLLATLFSQVLPALASRPDLRAPVLRAMRAVALAAWHHARRPDAEPGALRAALLGLCAALQAVVDDEDWDRGTVAPWRAAARACAVLRGRLAPSPSDPVGPGAGRSRGHSPSV